MNKKIVVHKGNKRYLEEWECHEEDGLVVFDERLNSEDITNDTRTDDEVLAGE